MVSHPKTLHAKQFKITDLLATTSSCTFRTFHAIALHNPTLIAFMCLNSCTGMLDSSLSISKSLSTPHLGGWVRFSKGTLFLLPQGGSSSSSSSSDASSSLSGLDRAFSAPASVTAATSPLSE